MKTTTTLILASLCSLLVASTVTLTTDCDEQKTFPDWVYEYLAIPMDKPLSTASKRALARNYAQDDSFFCEFRVHDLKGDLKWEEGVTRRDPSSVLHVDGTYFVYYSKSPGKSYGFSTGDPEKKVFPWDKCEVWYATSKDGWTWKEEGVAVPLGPKGSYDDRSVFTPEVLTHGGKYYLVYQTVKAPYANRVKNQVGMSVSDSPHGPFKRLPEPILSPTDDGEWLGEEDNRFLVKKRGSFDSHKVHDPCIVPYKGKFYLYYKGERMGERLTMGGREIKWGVAISDSIEGPYVKSEYNPITNSGHEICVWKYKDGIVAMLNSDGPEKGTIQYAKDGINFEIVAMISGRSKPPHAGGIVRDIVSDDDPLSAMEWGICFDRKDGWDYITRFESYKPFAP